MTDKPQILVDSREQTPLPIRGFPTKPATLMVGDYGILGATPWHEPGMTVVAGKPRWNNFHLDFVIERKSLPDLLSSWGTGREIEGRKWELLRPFFFSAYLIEAERQQIEQAAKGWGIGDMIRRGEVDRAGLAPKFAAQLQAADDLMAISQINPAAVLATEAALQVRFGIHVIWGGNPQGCARILEELVTQWCKGAWNANLMANGPCRRVKPRKGSGEDEKDNDAEALAAQGGL